MGAALRRHDLILRERIEGAGGYVFKTVGDAFCAAFSSAADAARAALDVQQAIRREPWELPRPLRVRIGLHTGSAELRDDDYFGSALNRAARLEAIAWGGQTVLSLVTEELVRDGLPRGAELVNLGTHRLKDLARPETVFELRHGGQQERFPQLRSLDAHLHNLPVEPTLLIGREHELQRLEQALLGGHVRLLSLVGPGGIGKTRLALQIAADVIDSFPDGAFVVDLASVRDPARIPEVIVETLRVGEHQAGSLEERLVEHLRRRRMILVIDNFEQVIEGSGAIARLLAACAELKVVITSREPLRVRGEHIFHVPPLSLPPAPVQGLPRAGGARAGAARAGAERAHGAGGARAEGATPASLSQYEAVRLFIDRAIDQDPDFIVTNENAPAIAEICVRLDGLPLAIELAAARVGLLTPDELLGHLSVRLNLLTGGPRDLPPRQRALRATIDWSFALLTPEEQRHFAELSVFRGGFTMNACEQVCAGAGRDASAILELTRSLVDKNLVVPTAQRGESRFQLMETIREYGAERLTALSTADRMFAAHAEYYGRFAEEAATRMEGSDQKRVFESIDLDIANVRAAADHFARLDDAEREARVVVALGRYWQVRGYLTEGRERLANVLGALPNAAGELRCLVAIWGALLAREQGDYEAAEASLADALAWSGASAPLREFALHEAGWTAYRRGDNAEARLRFDRCRETAGTIGDELYEWKSRLGIASSDLVVGNRASATVELEQARRFFREHGYPRLEAQALGNLGYAANARGDLAGAAALFERVLPISEELGDAFIRAVMLNNLGDNCIQGERFEESAARYEELLGAAAAIGNDRFGILALAGKAEALRALGRREPATQAAAAALELAGRLGEVGGWERGVALRVSADLQCDSGELEAARSMYSEAIQTFEAAGREELARQARDGYQSATDRLRAGAQAVDPESGA